MPSQLHTIVVRLSPATMTLAHEVWRRDQKHRAQSREAHGRGQGQRPSQRMQDELARVAADRPSHRDISELMLDVFIERLKAAYMAEGRTEVEAEEAILDLCCEVPDGDSEFCLAQARWLYRNERHAIGGAPSLRAAYEDGTTGLQGCLAYGPNANREPADPPAAEPEPAPAKARTGKRRAS